MRLSVRILFGLSGFLLLAATVYLLMSYGGASRDLAGPALMGVAAVAFGYVGLVLRAAARQADRAAAERAGAGGPRAEALVHVPPTIWPFAFSIAALALVIGAVVATRILVPLGLAVFAASAVGWFADVRRAHRH
jgi:small-conductance mechanosensitive channel